jgi:hypothetical protein
VSNTDYIPISYGTAEATTGAYTSAPSTSYTQASLPETKAPPAKVIILFHAALL